MTTKYRLSLARRMSQNLNALLETRGSSVDWYSSIDPKGDFIRNRFNNSRDEVIILTKGKGEIDPLIGLSTLTDDQKTLILALQSDSKTSLLTAVIKNAKSLGIHFNVDNVIIVSLNNKPPSKENMKLFYNSDERPLLEYFTFDELLINPLKSIFSGNATIDEDFSKRNPGIVKKDVLGRRTSNELLQMKSSDPISRFLGALKGDVIKVESPVFLPKMEHSKEMNFYIVR